MEAIHILYVDKSRVAHRLLSRGVEVIASVDFADSIAQARERLAAQPYTFFIIDCDLPDGDGLQLVREIRQHPAHATTPILLYTASLNNELAYRAMQAGCNDSLPKPTNLIDLRQRIVELVEVPEVRQVRRQLLQITCINWESDGVFHTYSPDLNLLIRGRHKDAVERRMKEALEARLAHGEHTHPAQVSLNKYIMRLDVGADQAA